MAENKYPYIPKSLYPAVMYACSLIRKYGTFNVSCRTAANRYGVDADDVEKHVRARQAAGQKGKSRKYVFFAVAGFYDEWRHEYDYDLTWSQDDPHGWEAEKRVVGKVIRATSEENMKKQIPRGYLDEDMRSCGETWKAVRWKKFETETEAKIGLNLLIETMEREET